MAKSYRQYTQCLKNSARDFTVCLTANFCIQANCVLILCLCACACNCVCMHERERGRRTLITLWNRIEYVPCSHEMSLNLKFGNWRYLHVSNLHVLLIVLIFTAVAGKRPRSFCQKFRWQVTTKHAYTLHMWLCMKWHGAWLYGVHRTRWDGSSFMWHQPCQHCMYTTSVDIQKCAIKSYSLM